eukprot:Unigene2391_Nuclearia_a/m.7375 Unigene2391_Nuclearia_a/g.7375  ORF Unigene2391_Nuclearia_a/g.7375 Unigene2391_Nuclearia_a/m.7375 type:complete len:438 (-) Unigene2391_Nuclearia_a:100-1413(-)
MPLEYALQREGVAGATAWAETPERRLAPTVVVGLETVPAQAVRAARQKGHVLNVMVAGESGLGKTTFLNTLFGDALVAPEDLPLAERATKAIRATTFALNENGVELKVTAVDTPGFGIQLNRTTGLQPVVDYVNNQLQNTLADEERTSFRTSAQDTLVHVCFYFISPTGHSLTELDVLAMRSLADKVNLIPVIGKADTLTREELHAFRARLMQQIKAAGIAIYPQAHTFVPETNPAEYEKYMPFAVVGSSTVIKTSDGRTVRARQYRWGVVEVENPEHSDFTRLRELVIRQNLNDLVEVSHAVHYEKYRAERLQSQGRADPILQSDKDFDERMEKERADFARDMQVREEKMRKLFEKKMAEKDEELKAKEQELIKKREQWMIEIENERKQLQAEAAEADRKMREGSSSNLAGEGGETDKKKKGLLGASSLLRPKKDK